MRWSVNRDSDVLTVMTTLIWVLTWLPQVLSAVAVLPKPVNVNLTSNNLRHMLKWQPGPGTPPGVYYHVSFQTEKGTSWIPVAGCEAVQHPLECNLTAALEPRTAYYVQLEAKLGNQSSGQLMGIFTPFIHSQLDPPLLTVTSCGRDLCVDLQPPEEGLRQFYDDLQYKLKIKNSSATFFSIKGLGKHFLKNLASSGQNCVSVCIWDDLESKTFNYSKPVCIFIPDVYSADRWISGVLCFLVIVMLVFGVLLFLTGFICQRGKPLPDVLVTIQHIDKEQVIVPCYSSLSSLLNIETTPPSTGKRVNSQSCPDDSDEESETESIDSYKLRVGINLLSSNLCPPSSSSPALDPQPSVSSNQTSVLYSSQPHFPGSTETPESSAGKNYTLSTDTDTDSLTGDSKETEKKEKEVVIEIDSQDVNLLTLTFGRHQEEEEEEEEEDLHHDLAEIEPESDCVSKEHSIAPTLPSHTLETEESACSAAAADDDDDDDEVEEEDYSGYMGRPCAHVLQKLL